MKKIMFTCKNAYIKSCEINKYGPKFMFIIYICHITIQTVVLKNRDNIDICKLAYRLNRNIVHIITRHSAYECASARENPRKVPNSILFIS